MADDDKSNKLSSLRFDLDPIPGAGIHQLEFMFLALGQDRSVMSQPFYFEVVPAQSWRLVSLPPFLLRCLAWGLALSLTVCRLRGSSDNAGNLLHEMFEEDSYRLNTTEFAIGNGLVVDIGANIGASTLMASTHVGLMFAVQAYSLFEFCTNIPRVESIAIPVF